MQIAVHPVNVARTKVRADERRTQVRANGVRDYTGTLAKPVNGPRITRHLLLSNLRLIFVELLKCVWETDIHRIDPEPAAKDPSICWMPRDSDARLKVLQIPVVQSAIQVNDRAEFAANGINRGRTEVADKAAGRVKWTFS